MVDVNRHKRQARPAIGQGVQQGCRVLAARVADDDRSPSVEEIRQAHGRPPQLSRQRFSRAHARQLKK
jgi:hypothetical protein